MRLKAGPCRPLGATLTPGLPLPGPSEPESKLAVCVHIQSSVSLISHSSYLSPRRKAGRVGQHPGAGLHSLTCIERAPVPRICHRPSCLVASRASGGKDHLSSCIYVLHHSLGVGVGPGHEASWEPQPKTPPRAATSCLGAHISVPTLSGIDHKFHTTGS